MAVSATFRASFENFEGAVEKAVVKLRTFDDRINAVDKDLQKFGNQFGGTKIIGDAQLMAKAIEDVGGASKLTEEEQRRVNATVSEALKKYKALGEEAPAELKKLSAELNTQTTSFKDLALAAGAIAGIVAGVSAGVAKLGERGSGVADVREHFAKLNETMGESADVMLGRLRAATLGNITDFELMKTANQALSQGLTLSSEQFGTLGDVSAVLADRIGGDVGEAFNALTQAMATGQDRMLKTIGLNIDAAKAEEIYAASIGRKRTELDEAEKKHAIQNAILAEGQRILDASGKAQVDFGDRIAQSNTKLGNFVDKISEWVATNPSIGAWTSTITAASSTITAFGLAFGPVSAGISKVLPLLGASGALGSAFASLGTLISTSVIPLVSVTLPAAFAAITPFLLPAGVIIGGVIGIWQAWKHWDDITAFFKGAWKYVQDAIAKVPDSLALLIPGIGAIVVAFRHWDDIKRIVEGVYTAAKTWLLDKFNAVIDKVKGAIQAVGDKFKWLYDVVVGNSYVPDMIKGIGKEFGSLESIMTQPTKIATDMVAKLFEGLSGKVNDLIGSMLKKIGLNFSTFTAQTMPAFGAEMGRQSTSIIGAMQAGLAGGLQGAIAGAASSLVQMGVGALVNKFSGGEEAQLNPARDSFMAQFGRPGWGAGTANEWLLDALQKLGADHLFQSLSAADEWAEYRGAVSNITNLLNSSGIKTPFGAEVREMARGGSGVVTKPTLFLAGEAGPESFAFSGANRQFASRADLSGVEQRLDVLRDELVQQRRDLPRAMRIAMSDAIALA